MSEQNLVETDSVNGKDPVQARLDILETKLDGLMEILVGVTEALDGISEQISNINNDFGDGFGVDSFES